MRKFNKLLYLHQTLVGVWLLASLSLGAAPLQLQDVPQPLQPWVNWVLHDHQDRACPFFPHYNQTDSDKSKNCRWPSRLDLKVGTSQAEFRQEWQVYEASWITLPGDTQSWPQAVQVNNAPVKVAEQAGQPRVFVPVGTAIVQGQLNWHERRPESLAIPAETGLVTLTIDNTSVLIPVMDEQGRLWLRHSGMQTGSETAEENRLDMRVYRHVIDEIPLQIITHLELDVAGRHREVVLGPALLEKQIAMSLDSPLPARLEPDGHLRIQVRPGTWVLTLQTRQDGLTNRLTVTPKEEGHWVKEEVWVFEARHELRFVEVTGVTGIDPQQTALPDNWRSWPAYQMQVGDTMELVEKRRGDPEPAPDQLHLERQFWLDFDGKGYSIQDRMSGSMTRGWRLEMTPPAVLGRVSVNGQDQFITRLPQSDKTGVEVRRGQIDLVADSRLEDATNQLPAVGWAHDFQQLSATLHLPPGWSLLHTIGTDDVPQTWLRQWTLLDLFIVLIIAGAIGKLWNWGWGMVGLVTVVLTYQEPEAPRFIWLNIIAALALLRVLPELGAFSRWVRLYRNLCLFSLLIIVSPFMMQQARQSLYPQLERPWAELETGATNYPMSVATTESEEANPEIRAKGGETMDMVQQQAMPAAKVPPPAPPEDGRYQAYSWAKQEMDGSGGYSFSSTGKTKGARLVQIDPNAQVQTGPGLPQWQWEDISMRWSGPVQESQSIELWLLSPTVNSMLGFARVIFMAILTVFLLMVSWRKGTWKWSKLTRTSSTPAAIATTAVFLVSLGCLLPHISVAEEAPANQLNEPNVVNLPPQDNQATLQNVLPVNSPEVNQANLDLMQTQPSGPFPPQVLLEKLEQRLLEPPDCLPACASSPRMRIEMDTSQLKIRMEIHSYVHLALPLPGVAKQWLPQLILLNDQPAQSVARTSDGKLWLSVPPGIHQVALEGPLPNRNTVQLPLPLKPHFVEIQSTGWQVEGLHENGITDHQLQFTREQTDTQLATLEMGSLPPFVQIERTFLLGLDWQVATRVTRLSPMGSAIVLDVPLLKGESVTTENIRVEGNKALINLSPTETEIHWLSVFTKQETIPLTASNSTFSREVWRVDASAIWHVEVEGIPVIHHQNDEGRWLPEWRPWPDETVILHLSRPEGVTGQVLTIDRSYLVVTPGQRTTDNTLTLTLRSSRGGQHTLTLPDQAKLQRVNINGNSQPIRQEGRKVTLPITPGEQRVELQYQQPVGMSQHFATAPVELGIPSVNTHVQIQFPADRWILFVGGDPTGPAVMVWGLIIVIFLASLGLGRVSLTPLKFHHWFLLGLVISQVHIASTLVIVIWFIALGKRKSLPVMETSAFKFDLIQLGLALLTVAAFLTLIAAIEKGLLGQPQMHIAGNGSNADLLRWYEDRTMGTIPSVWVFSWSLWVYQIAMLLWALWLAFALMRWLRWGWECFSQQGWWKPLLSKKAVQV